MTIQNDIADPVPLVRPSGLPSTSVADSAINIVAMNTIFWLVVSLATFDGLLLTALYFGFRRHAPFDRSTLWAIGGGLLGFASQALTFYHGAILILQLATIAGAFAICLLAPRGAREQ